MGRLYIDEYEENGRDERLYDLVDSPEPTKDMLLTLLDRHGKAKIYRIVSINRDYASAPSRPRTTVRVVPFREKPIPRITPELNASINWLLGELASGLARDVSAEGEEHQQRVVDFLEKISWSGDEG